MSSVLHLITTIKRGGAENQLLVLAKEQVKSGIRVHIVYLKDEPELEKDFENIGAIVHHDLSNLKFWKQPSALRKLIFGDNWIVHSHLPRAELVGLFCIKKFHFIITRHNAEQFFPRAPKLLSNFLSRLVSLRADKIIAISNAVKLYLMQQGEVRNALKLEVVLYGYEPSFSEEQRSCSEPSRIKKIGTISRLTDQKDIPTMLESFRKYLQIEPSATLAILGEGSLEVTLKDLTESLNLGDSVKFLGRSSRIYDFLHGLDAFILTSKYEGFGLVLLEAMDVGIPIVASRNSAIPEVLGSEFPSLCETGNSTDFSNKLNLLNDFKYREGIKVIQEGRLALFSSTVMSQKISQIYSS